jgi:hypothetical protein
MTHDGAKQGKEMAGRQTVVHAGLQFWVEPAFRLRRLFHFPFYFESTNPSFRVFIKRVSEAPTGGGWEKGTITFQVLFANDTLTPIDVPVPELDVGQTAVIVFPGIYTAYPGQTIIRILVEQAIIAWRPEVFKTLYSYQVRPEEQIWLALYGPVGAALGAGATILIQRWFG